MTQLTPIQAVAPISQIRYVARPLQMIKPLQAARPIQPFDNTLRFDEIKKARELNSISDVLFNSKARQRATEKFGDGSELTPLATTVVAGYQYLTKQYVEPIMDADFNQLMSNSWNAAMEDIDVLSNPMKGLVIGSGNQTGSLILGALGSIAFVAGNMLTGGTLGLATLSGGLLTGGIATVGTALLSDPAGAAEGFAKGLGISDAGRFSYRYDTGNFLLDYFGEIVTDPLNWLSAAGTMYSAGAAEIAAKQPVESIASSLVGNIIDSKYDSFGLMKALSKVDNYVTMAALMANPIGASLGAAYLINKKWGSFALNAARESIVQLMTNPEVADLVDMGARMDVGRNAVMDLVSKTRNEYMVELGVLGQVSNQDYFDTINQMANHLYREVGRNPHLDLEFLERFIRDIVYSQDLGEFFTKQMPSDLNVSLLDLWRAGTGQEVGLAAGYVKNKFTPGMLRIDQYFREVMENVAIFDAHKDLMRVKFKYIDEAIQDIVGTDIDSVSRYDYMNAVFQALVEDSPMFATADLSKLKDSTVFQAISLRYFEPAGISFDEFVKWHDAYKKGTLFVGGENIMPNNPDLLGVSVPETVEDGIVQMVPTPVDVPLNYMEDIAPLAGTSVLDPDQTDMYNDISRLSERMSRDDRAEIERELHQITTEKASVEEKRNGVLDALEKVMIPKVASHFRLVQEDPLTKVQANRAIQLGRMKDNSMYNYLETFIPNASNKTKATIANMLSDYTTLHYAFSEVEKRGFKDALKVSLRAGYNESYFNTRVNTPQVTDAKLTSQRVEREFVPFAEGLTKAIVRLDSVNFHKVEQMLEADGYIDSPILDDIRNFDAINVDTGFRAQQAIDARDEGYYLAKTNTVYEAGLMADASMNPDVVKLASVIMDPNNPLGQMTQVLFNTPTDGVMDAGIIKEAQDLVTSVLGGAHWVDFRNKLEGIAKIKVQIDPNRKNILAMANPVKVEQSKDGKILVTPISSNKKSWSASAIYKHAAYNEIVKKGKGTFRVVDMSNLDVLDLKEVPNLVKAAMELTNIVPRLEANQKIAAIEMQDQIKQLQEQIYMRNAMLSGIREKLAEYSVNPEVNKTLRALDNIEAGRQGMLANLAIEEDRITRELVKYEDDLKSLTDQKNFVTNEIAETVQRRIRTLSKRALTQQHKIRRTMIKEEMDDMYLSKRDYSLSNLGMAENIVSLNKMVTDYLKEYKAGVKTATSFARAYNKEDGQAFPAIFQGRPLLQEYRDTISYRYYKPDMGVIKDYKQGIKDNKPLTQVYSEIKKKYTLKQGSRPQYLFQKNAQPIFEDYGYNLTWPSTRAFELYRHFDFAFLGRSLDHVTRYQIGREYLTKRAHFVNLGFKDNEASLKALEFIINAGRAEFNIPGELMEAPFEMLVHLMPIIERLSRTAPDAIPTILRGYHEIEKAFYDEQEALEMTTDTYVEAIDRAERVIYKQFNTGENELGNIGVVLATHPDPLEAQMARDVKKLVFTALWNRADVHYLYELSEEDLRAWWGDDFSYDFAIASSREIVAMLTDGHYPKMSESNTFVWDVVHIKEFLGKHKEFNAGDINDALYKMIDETKDTLIIKNHMVHYGYRPPKTELDIATGRLLTRNENNFFSKMGYLKPVVETELGNATGWLPIKANDWDEATDPSTGKSYVYLRKDWYEVSDDFKYTPVIHQKNPGSKFGNVNKLIEVRGTEGGLYSQDEFVELIRKDIDDVKNLQGTRLPGGQWGYAAKRGKASGGVFYARVLNVEQDRSMPRPTKLTKGTPVPFDRERIDKVNEIKKLVKATFKNPTQAVKAGLRPEDFEGTGLVGLQNLSKVLNEQALEKEAPVIPFGSMTPTAAGETPFEPVKGYPLLIVEDPNSSVLVEPDPAAYTADQKKIAERVVQELNEIRKKQLKSISAYKKRYALELAQQVPNDAEPGYKLFLKNGAEAEIVYPERSKALLDEYDREVMLLDEYKEYMKFLKDNEDIGDLLEMEAGNYNPSGSLGKSSLRVKSSVADDWFRRIKEGKDQVGASNLDHIRRGRIAKTYLEALIEAGFITERFKNFDFSGISEQGVANYWMNLDRFVKKEMMDLDLFMKYDDTDPERLNTLVKTLRSNEAEGAFNFEDLYAANLDELWSIARTFKGRGVEVESLVTVGALGLEAAALRFNPEVGGNFQAYMRATARGYMQHEIYDHGGKSDLPDRLRAKAGKFAHLREVTGADTYAKVKARLEDMIADQSKLSFDYESYRAARIKYRGNDTLHVRLKKPAEHTMVFTRAAFPSRDARRAYKFGTTQDVEVGDIFYVGKYSTEVDVLSGRWGRVVSIQEPKYADPVHGRKFAVTFEYMTRELDSVDGNFKFAPKLEYTVKNIPEYVGTKMSHPHRRAVEQLEKTLLDPAKMPTVDTVIESMEAGHRISSVLNADAKIFKITLAPRKYVNGKPVLSSKVPPMVRVYAKLSTINEPGTLTVKAAQAVVKAQDKVVGPVQETAVELNGTSKVAIDKKKYAARLKEPVAPKSVDLAIDHLTEDESADLNPIQLLVNGEYNGYVYREGRPVSHDLETAFIGPTGVMYTGDYHGTIASALSSALERAGVKFEIPEDFEYETGAEDGRRSSTGSTSVDILKQGYLLFVENKWVPGPVEPTPEQYVIIKSHFEYLKKKDPELYQEALHYVSSLRDFYNVSEGPLLDLKSWEEAKDFLDSFYGKNKPVQKPVAKPSLADKYANRAKASADTPVVDEVVEVPVPAAAPVSMADKYANRAKTTEASATTKKSLTGKTVEEPGVIPDVVGKGMIPNTYPTHRGFLPSTLRRGDAVAFVGSRELGSSEGKFYKRMVEVQSKLIALGLISRSGGAEGVDSIVTRMAPPENREIYVPWENFAKDADDNVIEDEIVPYYLGNQDQAYLIAKKYYPGDLDAQKNAVGRLMARNTYQILGQDLRSPAKFVVCWTPTGKATGGTGQAIRLAQGMQVPVFNLANEDDYRALTEYLYRVESNRRRNIKVESVIPDVGSIKKYTAKPGYRYETKFEYGKRVKEALPHEKPATSLDESGVEFLMKELKDAEPEVAFWVEKNLLNVEDKIAWFANPSIPRSVLEYRKDYQNLDKDIAHVNKVVNSLKERATTVAADAKRRADGYAEDAWNAKKRLDALMLQAQDVKGLLARVEQLNNEKLDLNRQIAEVKDLKAVALSPKHKNSIILSEVRKLFPNVTNADLEIIYAYMHGDISRNDFILTMVNKMNPKDPRNVIKNEKGVLELTPAQASELKDAMSVEGGRIVEDLYPFGDKTLRMIINIAANMAASGNASPTIALRDLKTDADMAVYFKVATTDPKYKPAIDLAIKWVKQYLNRQIAYEDRGMTTLKFLKSSDEKKLFNFATVSLPKHIDGLNEPETMKSMYRGKIAMFVNQFFKNTYDEDTNARFIPLSHMLSKGESAINEVNSYLHRYYVKPKYSLGQFGETHINETLMLSSVLGAIGLEHPNSPFYNTFQSMFRYAEEFLDPSLPGYKERWVEGSDKVKLSFLAALGMNTKSADLLISDLVSYRIKEMKYAREANQFTDSKYIDENNSYELALRDGDYPKAVSMMRERNMYNVAALRSYFSDNPALIPDELFDKLARNDYALASTQELWFEYVRDHSAAAFYGNKAGYEVEARSVASVFSQLLRYDNQNFETIGRLVRHHAYGQKALFFEKHISEPFDPRTLLKLQEDYGITYKKYTLVNGDVVVGLVGDKNNAAYKALTPIKGKIKGPLNPNRKLVGKVFAEKLMNTAYELDIMSTQMFPFEALDILPMRFDDEFYVQIMRQGGIFTEEELRELASELQDSGMMKFGLHGDADYMHSISKNMPYSPMNMLISSTASKTRHGFSKAYVLRMIFEPENQLESMLKTSDPKEAFDMYRRMQKSVGKTIEKGVTLVVVDRRGFINDVVVNNVKDMANALAMKAVPISYVHYKQLSRLMNTGRLPKVLAIMESQFNVWFKGSIMTNPAMGIRNVFVDNPVKLLMHSKGNPKIFYNLARGRYMMERTKVIVAELIKLTSEKDKLKFLLGLAPEDRYAYNMIERAIQAGASGAPMAAKMDIADYRAAREAREARGVQQAHGTISQQIVWENPVTNLLLRLNSDAEDMYRLAAFIWDVENGQSFSSAAKNIGDTFVDYDVKNEYEEILNTVLMFPMFRNHNAIFWADHALDNPFLLRAMLDLVEQSWVEKKREQNKALSSYQLNARGSGNLSFGDSILKLNPSFFDAVSAIPGLLAQPLASVSPVIKDIGALLSGNLDGIAMPWESLGGRASHIVQGVQELAQTGQTSMSNIAPGLFSGNASFKYQPYNIQYTTKMGARNPARVVSSSNYYRKKFYHNIWDYNGKPRFANPSFKKTMKGMKYRF